ncbi:hypothetical protein V5O48_018709, partial [Marasmius crinis-equi]
KRIEAVSCKIDDFLKVVETMDPKEKEVTALVSQYGGESAVLKNDEILDRIAASMGRTLTASIKYTLRANLDDILKANVGLYELKVEATARRIEDAVERSMETILLKLDSGPHDAIEDGDIRAVWKAVQHHFGKQFASYQIVHGEPHPDKWTLEFISKVIFYPAIGDAIDEDGSGFISIHEVNRFFRKKPNGWKSCEWLAYWGIGWYRNAITYKKWCLQLLNYIENSERLVHVGNLESLGPYLGKDCIGDVRVIVNSVYTNTLSVLGQTLDLSHDRFQFLRKQKMEQEMEMVRSRLVKTKYQIDSPVAVSAICGTQKLEHTFLCMLSVILMHHKQVIKLGERAMLSEQEFTTMIHTITNATSAFESRLNLLLECWRQQRMEARLQLQSFASGLFEDWWIVYFQDDDEDEEDDFDLADIRKFEADPDSDGESDDDGDAADRILPSPDEPTSPTSLLVYPIPPQPRDPKRQNSILSASTVSAGTGSIRSSDRVPMSRRRAKEVALEVRMDAMENQLAMIESLLRKLLSSKKSG